jgi:hypothetical protein
MRTTLDLPDETFRQLKAEAALRGTKLKDLIAQFIEKGLASRPAAIVPRPPRSPLPQVRPPSGTVHPALSNAEIDSLLSHQDAHD